MASLQSNDGSLKYIYPQMAKSAHSLAYISANVISSLGRDGPRPRLCVVKSKRRMDEKLGFTVNGARTKPGLHQISEVKRCSAAHRAGLRSGDLIVAIGSQNALDLTYLELITLIQERKMQGDLVLAVTNPFELDFYREKIVTPVAFF